jgi:hypothetical protein
MALIRVEDLPEEPLAAAARFHDHVLPRIRAELEAGADHLTLVFTAAGHGHRGWRLASVQELAREYAPVRVNGIESSEEAATTAAHAFLSGANGVTGQLLALDGNGAGPVLYGER